MSLIWRILFLFLFPVPLWAGVNQGEFAQRRQALLNEIKEDITATQKLTGRSRLAPTVLEAMGKVPREKFVSASLQKEAYTNRPLPIGYGQTISQPYIVALMTDLLELEKGQRVLEIGTGSGYQAAVLAEITPQVFTIEIIPALAESARARLRKLGYDTVQVKTGDGYFGWKEHAPFDAIIVTAAAGQIPPPLLQQLKPGGRMVIPIGTPFSTQQLMLITKDNAGKLTNRQILPVQFVPFKRTE